MNPFVRGALALCVMFAAAAAQQADKVAIYMSGKHQSDDLGELVATAMMDALANSENFIVAERTKEFLKTIEAENMYQFSGAVDNSQIAEVGKKLGVAYICVAELVNLGEFFNGSRESMLTARFINVQSATIVGSTYRIGVLNDEDAIYSTAEKLAKDLIDDFKKRNMQAKLENAAIYSTGGSISGMDMVTQPLLINAVVRSGKYAVSERTSSFLESLSQEHGMQYSGEVDENQLAALGMQSGVKYVIAINKVMSRVNLRMIDVKTGGIVPGMTKSGKIDTSNVKSIENSVAELISAFLKTEVGTLFKEMTQAKEEQEHKEKAQAEEQARRAETQEKMAKTQEWRSLKKPGMSIGAGGSDGAQFFSVGAAYTLPFTRNILFAPEAGILLGSYKNNGFGEDKYTFFGASVPVLLQYITSATSVFALFAEAGAEADFLVDTDGITVLNYGGVAGAGIVLNFGGRRMYLDVARFCIGSEYLSYTFSARLMF